MKIAVLANDELKMEMTKQGISSELNIDWLGELHQLQINPAGIIIDLLYDQQPDEHLKFLIQSSPKLVVINSVIDTAASLPPSFVRINGWPGFLQRPLVEAASHNPENKIQTTSLFALFNKKTEWVADIPGFITARILSMIINEAYFALEQKLSTKEDIDIAMKLGTNYPYGPFEWAQIIGTKKVFTLLDFLSRSDERYKPSELLKSTALY